MLVAGRIGRVSRKDSTLKSGIVCLNPWTLSACWKLDYMRMGFRFQNREFISSPKLSDRMDSPGWRERLIQLDGDDTTIKLGLILNSHPSGKIEPFSALPHGLFSKINPSQNVAYPPVELLRFSANDPVRLRPFRTIRPKFSCCARPIAAHLAKRLKFPRTILLASRRL